MDEKKDGKLVESNEYKVVKRITSSGLEQVKHLWGVPVGSAGLLFWVLAIITALNAKWGALIAFGFGVVFVYRAKKELKAKQKEEAKSS